MIFLRASFILLLLCSPFLGWSYEVEFCGNLTKKIKELLNNESQLILFQNNPPPSEAGLRYRAEGDIANFLRVMTSQAYYGASVDLKYDFQKKNPLVIVSIEPDAIYSFSHFTIIPSEQCTFSYNRIQLEDLGIQLNQPAYPQKIFEAEEKLLAIMAFQGYPLAKITEREVIGDQANQTIQVNLHLESGPPVLFGNTSITGLKNIDEEFIQSKIAWNKDDPFNPIEIEKTQTALEATGLFSSINISHAKNPNSNHSLPMFLEVVEAKHRSISAGLAYNTERGPGFTAEWEHRNIRNMGEKLRLGGTFWAKTQKIKLIYIKPDWMCPAQDLAFLMEGDFEKTRGYRESAFSITPLITRQINEQLRISYGVMYKALRDTSSIPDGNYNLLKAPFSLRWSDANNLLDATIGKTLHFKCIPSWQFIHPRFAYCINELTLNCYQPITEDCRWMIASKVTFGSIWGSSRRTIPASERFYEGSENSLRGYRYLSVSPLCDKKPIGGRSMILYNAELRWRATETIGLVGFYDVGNVYAQILPNLKEGVLQSTGAGIRYHTPVGPLRLDFAIPLNRRKGLDSPFQIYFSIGQAF